ncbi:autotransporter-associated beta strand repeat-containing protein [Dyella halodurans]|uniref:Autotransporter-associated beta strand repeat-containing protein n=1 Tax=Dyella halodurans TaxID=1920171 RepID=A0ABV9BWR9_9GAMM|nr:autotransporter-associated beta strand repeat-containing protein [Dyella halodurans]
MNRTYRLVWNKSLRRVQVASEHAKASHGAVATGAMGTATPALASRAPLALAVALLLGASFAPSARAQSFPVAAGGVGGQGATAGALVGGAGGTGADNYQTEATSGTSGSTGAAGGAAGSDGNFSGHYDGFDGGAAATVSADGVAGGGGGGGGTGMSYGSIGSGGFYTLAGQQAGNGGNGGAGAMVAAGYMSVAGGGGGGGAGGYADDIEGFDAINLTGFSYGGRGGNGGNGGNGSAGTGAQGGQGGQGGFGVMTTVALNTILNGAGISGGNGGNGGNGGDSLVQGADGAAGADGGIGLIAVGATSAGHIPTLSVSNAGVVTGGAGGNGGAGGAFTPNPTTGNGGSGGVGGQGAAGATLSYAGLNNTNTVTGGNGGNGGAAAAGGNGGAGGQAGNGLEMGLGTTLSNSGWINGGTGGVGGNAVVDLSSPWLGGNGGQGGVGILASGGGAITNLGQIRGGDGGIGGMNATRGLATGDQGGAAIVAMGGEQIYNAGWIQGGTNQDGQASHAAAVMFHNGGNTLQLWNGSTVIGNVVSDGAGDTLSLGIGLNAQGQSSGNGVFDASKIGTQYTGFSAYNLQGAVTWTLTGTTTVVTPWTVTTGVLSIADNGSLGDDAGTLTLDGGTLQTTANVTMGRNVQITANGGNVDTENNSALAINGDVSGGMLVKNGNGVLTLGGANTFQGLVITAGSVSAATAAALGDDTYTLEIDGGTLTTTGNMLLHRDILLGATGGTINNDAFGLTLAGHISGGALIKTGGAMLALTGNNSQSSTSVNGGTLAVSSDSALGASGGTLGIDGGVFEFDAGFDIARPVVLGSGGATVTTAGQNASISGAISGTGSFFKTGMGTLSLSGANTFAGATTVDMGTLALLTPTSLASSSGVTVNRATLDVSNTGGNVILQSLGGSGSVVLGANSLTLINAHDTFSGNISGAGGLTLNGGTEILTGQNTYTGATVVNAGELVVTSSATLASNAIQNNGTVNFNQTDTITHDTAIVGSGGIHQTGAGTTILNGQNTATGLAKVSNGTVEIGDENHADATWAGDAQVDGSGVLRGHGTILGGLINDSIVRPGGSIGVLTVNGDYTQTANGTLAIDVTPSAASELVVNGNASLAGNLSLIYAPGTYTATTFKVLEAHNVTGTFGATSSSGSVPTDLTPTVSYSATDVSVSLATAQAPTNPTNPGNPTTPTAPTQPTAPVIVAPQGGALFANAQRLAVRDGQGDMSDVLNASGRGGHGVWAVVTGGNTSLPGANRMDSTGFGINAGFDVAAGDVASVGVEGGVQRTNATDAMGGKARVDGLHAGVYGFANVGPVVLSGLADAWNGHYDFTRQTGVGGAVARPDGQAYNAALQAAWPIHAGGAQITPKVGVMYQNQRMDGFSETVVSSSQLASAYGVSSADSRENQLNAFAGLSFVRAFKAGGIDYVPSIDVGYQYAMRSTASSITVATGDGTVFPLAANELGRGLTTVGASITAKEGATWDVSLGYQGAFASGMHDNAFSVGFTKHF